MPESHDPRLLPAAGQALLRQLPKQRKSIRRKILWQSLLLSGFTVMVLSLLSVIVGRSLIQNRVLDQLSSTLTSRENQLSQAILFDRERTGLLAVQLEQRRDLTTLHPGSAAVGDLWKRLHDENIPALGITYFNAQGNVIDHMGTDAPLPSSPPQGTTLVPELNRRGMWEATDIFTPVHTADEKVAGILAVRYDPTALLDALADNGSLGKTQDLLLVHEQDGKVSTLYQGNQAARTFANDTPTGSFTIPDAVQGKSGIFTGKDEWGEEILAAYRTVPSTGWSMILKMDTDEALAGWDRFVYTLLALDGVLLALTTIFGLILARELSAPILDLAGKLKVLQPGSWAFQRSVRTGDEVEFLDVVAEELTSRLRVAYTHLEDEVKARTEDLRKQFLLDRSILEHIEYGVFVTDANGAILDVNPAGARMLQKTREDLLGKPSEQELRFFRRQLPLSDGSHPVTQALQKKARIRLFHSDHLTVLTGKDMSLPITLNATPLLEGESLFGALVILEDVREENRVDEMKSEFITLASHQLRTPLASMRWYLELMGEEKDPVLSEMQQSYLKEIEVGTKRMINLLDDLLRITRLEGEEIRAEKRACELRKLLQDVYDEWKPLAVEHGMEFSVNLPPDPATAFTDPVLLHLVLQNLFTNAVKYSPKGTHITMSIIPDGGQAVTITVTDNGIGIPEDEQKHIFEKFFRAKNVKKIDADGSGLGLYLTRRIVENLGGHISFKSAEGKGTTFTVELPVQ